MTPERWQQIRAVYEHAESLSGADLEGYLSAACASDRELREEVESLLGYDGLNGSDFLETPAASLLQTGESEETAPSRIGLRVGVYEILSEIGHGGMGEVYRAARADGQYDKQVAIKLVRVGLDTSYILRSFRHERQILASLDHPNIARLLDGGTTEDGIPYLVMELVEGVRIDDYCQKHQLSVSQRLELFRQVCGAVEYAHQRLVIHRDIKPNNILVTEEGVPKLLDFGIAKILDPTGGEEVTVARPMTVEYASPEQIRGEAITTASDVYSLGVVLFRLLTGKSPYPEGATTSHELSLSITQAEPRRPSSVVGGTNSRTENTVAEGESDEICSSREPTRAKLQRRLAGDVDNILLMTLRKEPVRRYASVQQFSEDIARHLEGRPVAASKNSWRYRAGKFVARHRAGVVAAMLAAVALIAGIAMILRSDRLARAERTRAEARFNDVRKLANSLIFDVNDAMADLPGNTVARKLLLDRAVEYLDRLTQDAVGNSDLQRELAWGFLRLATVQGSSVESNLGQVSAAETSNHKALALFEAVARANPRNVTDQLNLARAHRVIGEGDVYYPAGRPELERAISITDRVMQTDGANPEVRMERASEYRMLGFSQGLFGDRTQSVESYRNALALMEDVRKSDPAYRDMDALVAKTNVRFGFQLAQAGNLNEAEQRTQAGIAAFEALVKRGTRPDTIRDLATSRMRLGWINLMRGDTMAADHNFELMRAAIEPLAKLDPANTMLQLDLWGQLFEHGRVLVFKGKFAEAETALEQAIKGFEDMHSETDSGPGNGLMFAWLGEAQFGAKNYAGALKSYQESIAAIEKDPPFDDNRCGLAEGYIKIGNTLTKLNRLDEAAASYRKAESEIASSPHNAHFTDDIPMLYPLAGLQGAMGDLAMERAHRAHDVKERSKFQEEACASYQKSAAAWHQIPQVGLLSPSQFPSSNPRNIAAQLAQCGDRAVQAAP